MESDSKVVWERERDGKLAPPSLSGDVGLFREINRGASWPQLAINY